MHCNMSVLVFSPGTFHGMDHIEKLWLVGNGLSYCHTSLPSNVFEGLESLKELALGQVTWDEGSGCPSYPYGIFEHTPSLEFLAMDIYREELAPIASDIVKLRHLHTIEFTPCSFKAITNQSLVLLRNSTVRAVMLTLCTLERIETGAFKDIPSLETIVMTDLRQFSLAKWMPALDNVGITPLHNLAMDFGYLKSIDEFSKDLFCNSLGRNLRKLSISRFNFHNEFDLEALKCLTQLLELTFMYSQTFNFEYEVTSFAFYFYIGILHGHDHIKTINLYRLGTSPEKFRIDFMVCTPRDTTGCNKRITDYFAPEGPIQLYDSDTRVEPKKGLIPRLSIPKSLTHLYFSEYRTGCPTMEGSHTLYLDSNLRYVDLHDLSFLCKAGWLDTKMGITGAQNLAYLDLSRNDLASLPRILDADNLKVLNASHNRLGQAGNIGWKMEKEFFWNSRKLVELDISSNELGTLPGDLLIQLHCLRILRLGNNKLIDIIFMGAIHAQLVLVDMSSNQISHLGKGSLPKSNTLLNISLVLNLLGNPFLCDCQLKRTVKWLRKPPYGVTLLDKEKYECFNDRGKTVLTLNTMLLCPVGLAAGSSASVALVFCVLLCAIIYRHRKIIRVNWYIFKRKIKRTFLNLPETTLDAYIIYNNQSPSDRVYVTRYLRVMMEDQWGFHLYIWDRDSVPGHLIADSIVEGISSCTKIIIIHSANLFENESEHTGSSSNNQNQSDDQTLPCNIDLEIIPDNVGDNPNIVSEQRPCGHDLRMSNNIYSEWVDYALLTAMTVLSHVPICVVRRDVVPPGSVFRKWRPLLYPNEYFSPIHVIKTNSPNFEGNLRAFMSSSQSA